MNTQFHEINQNYEKNIIFYPVAERHTTLELWDVKCKQNNSDFKSHNCKGNNFKVWDIKSEMWDKIAMTFLYLYPWQKQASVDD